MAVIADRVQETSTTSGTGTLTLAGAVSGYQAFSAAFTTGSVVYYCIVDGVNWEVGIGTYTTSGTTLSRTTVLASSNAGALITCSASVKNVFCTAPAAYLASNLVKFTTITATNASWAKQTMTTTIVAQAIGGGGGGGAGNGGPGGGGIGGAGGLLATGTMTGLVLGTATVFAATIGAGGNGGGSPTAGGSSSLAGIVTAAGGGAGATGASFGAGGPGGQGGGNGGGAACTASASGNAAAANTGGGGGGGGGNNTSNGGAGGSGVIFVWEYA